MKKYMKEIIISSISIVGFALVAIFVFAIGSKGFDEWVYNNVISIKSDGMTGFATFITFFGGKIFTIILGFVTLFLLINRNKSTYKTYFKNKDLNNATNLFMPWLIFISAVLLVTVLFLALKEIFVRPRPYDWFLIEEGGWSFPSGHTATSVAMYGAICLILNRSVNKKWIKWIITILTITQVSLIALSRIYLGVHFATDILGGVCLGGITLAIANICYKATNTKVCYINNHNDKKVETAKDNNEIA